MPGRRPQQYWSVLVQPFSEFGDVADRERARLLAALLSLVLIGGFSSGVIQWLLIDNFLPTFRIMNIALFGVGIAWALSRTRHYRIAAALAVAAIIGACALTGHNDPSDRVWYGFMLMGVLVAATFLTTLSAACVAMLSAATIALIAALTPELHAPERWLPPLMLHAVLSPLILVLSHHRTQVERKRNEVLRNHERKLHEVRRLETLGKLASGVAHDFNNLLTVILSNNEILARSRAYDAERVKDIDAAGQRAARFVDQLLRFARGQPAECTRADVNHVVAELRPILERLKGNNVQLDIELEPDLPTVDFEQSQLEQVILNLVVNARDAMPNGGKLVICTTKRETQALCVALRVSDTGTGMDLATRQALFEPFFTTKAREGGTGLGLSIVQSAVLKSGGSINVESEIGRGSSFEIVLPCATPISSRVAEHGSEAHEAQLESRRA